MQLPTFGRWGAIWIKHPDLRQLGGEQLQKALARIARHIKKVGPDGVSATEYIRRVSDFDPDDEVTASLLHALDSEA